MGCICSKGLANQYNAENNERNQEVKPNKHLKKKRLEAHAGIDNSGNDATARLISNPRTEENVGFAPVLSDEVGKRAVVSENLTKPQLPKPSSMEVGGSSGGQAHTRVSRATSVTNGEKGAQVIAGWPSWLTAVAGEAISGWVPRKAESFEKLEKIGQGTYSSVYKARDLETNKLVALKKVRFATMDPESVRFMAREILILRRLDHPNIMKLEGLITSRVSGSLYLVFEYMEHDLAGLASRPGVKFTEAQIKCYMRQLLQGLEHCHSQGVLHRDIKGSNLLIDNYGNLKIGDFGLANFYGVHQRQPLTSRVVTLWYRPPELLLGSTDYGVAVDLWSAGCIVAELFAGKPIMPGRTEVEQLHKIFKLCGSPSEEYWKRSKLPHATIFKPTHPYKRCVAETFNDFPSSTLSLLEMLLAVEPEGRGTASSALQSEFFTMKPLPCDPLTLPKYPPSKEFDAKLRDEEARRQKAVGKEQGYESLKKGSRVSKAVPAPDANAELQSSIQKHKGQHNPKSVSEKFNHEEEGGSGFPIEPPRDMSRNGIPLSGQSMLLSAFGSHNMNARAGQSRSGAELRTPRSNVHHGAVELSRFSNSVAARSESWFDSSGETSMNSHWPEERINGGYSQLNGGDSSGKQEWSHHLLERPRSSHKNKDEPALEKEPSAGYAFKKNRIHYSGPLMPAGGNLDEMLKEHEKKIQHAVRKARVDKAKTKKTHNGPGLITESLLHHGRNGKG
ncbi:probable serine/threonine-protein kinase At1g09600 [Humulus lupulus]|uniref:probable serine/threonine-protein kinase At1g09600 n=1 Tax=Humulus lupulus TaxID=3486 RepID=UPI002B408DBB|nr:probable serine/threonine-protein kinase At1g09600 [Humulus lupulus]